MLVWSTQEHLKENTTGRVTPRCVSPSFKVSLYILEHVYACIMYIVVTQGYVMCGNPGHPKVLGMPSPGTALTL